MMSLLILVNKKDSSFVDKILDFTEQTKQESIIIYVMKTLMKLSEETDWLPKETWISTILKKPIIEAVYSRMLRDLQMNTEYINLLTANKKSAECGYFIL